MSDTELIRIFTPAGLLLEEEVRSVRLPSAKGEIGILPGHARYTGLLGTGIMEYESVQSGKSISCVISGGFCNDSEDVLTILADSVDFPDTIDRENYANDREKLKGILDTINSSEPRWQDAQTRLSRIEALDELLSH